MCTFSSRQGMPFLHKRTQWNASAGSLVCIHGRRNQNCFQQSVCLCVCLCVRRAVACTLLNDGRVSMDLCRAAVNIICSAWIECRRDDTSVLSRHCSTRVCGRIGKLGNHSWESGNRIELLAMLKFEVGIHRRGWAYSADALPQS